MEYNFIAEIMKRNNLTDRDMAAFLNINYGNISMWRSRKRKIPQKYHVRLLEISKMDNILKPHRVISIDTLTEKEKFAISNTYRLINAINAKFKTNSGKKLVRLALTKIGHDYVRNIY